MPVYVRPKLAVIEESGSGLGVLALILGAVVAAAAVAAFIAAHLVLLAVVAVAFAAVMTGMAVAMRRAASPRRLRQHLPARYTATAAPARASEAISAPRPRAIAAPVQHVHFHFHGVSAEDVAAIIRRQETPGRPAIEEDPWSPPSSSPS